MGCVASNERTLEKTNGEFIGIYKALPRINILVKGKYYFNNGDIYNGYFLQNRYNGKGELITKDEKNILRGNWENNKLNGKSYIETENFIYKGDIRKGIMDGMGKIIVNNYEYIGEISNNIIHGYGKLLLCNKIIFQGKWRINKPLEGIVYYKEKNSKINLMNDINEDDTIIKQIKLFSFNYKKIIYYVPKNN